MLLWGFVPPAACAPAGAPPEGTGERVDRTSAAILGGAASDASQDAVVMLVFLDASTGFRGICTAALIAPRLVLSARHCVADTDADVACSVDGSSAGGGVVKANHDPRSLYIFTGNERPDLDPKTWKPAGRGVEVLDDGSRNLCNHDLALVLLEQPIIGAPVAPLRLDGTVEKGEKLTTIGWGVTSTAEPRTRQQRSGVVVTRVGPDDTDPVLTPNELAFDESICLGDSGGPVLSQESGAIVGVVSRGGNGTRSGTSFASTCTKATNLATKLAPFRDLLTRGFERAGAEPKVEPRKEEPSSGCTVSRARPKGSRAMGLGSLFLLAVAALRRTYSHIGRRRRIAVEPCGAIRCQRGLG